MFRTLMAVLVFAVLVGSGVVHGIWTNRWGTQYDLDANTARIRSLPMTIGDWDGRPTKNEEDFVPFVHQGRCMMRNYVNRVDGRVVTIYVTCGQRNEMLFNHTPMSCLPSHGFAVLGGPAKRPLSIETARACEFLMARFSKSDALVPQHLQIYWSWNGDGAWRTPESPRLTFTDNPVLYKVWVLHGLAHPEESTENDPSADFLRVLVPELDKVLFAPV